MHMKQLILKHSTNYVVLIIILAVFSVCILMYSQFLFATLQHVTDKLNHSVQEADQYARNLVNIK
jgi:fatty acid desaturase